MDILSGSLRKSEEDRRKFLKSCGRFAATVPPTMTVMLSTSLTSKAIAKSTGAGEGGSGHSDTGAKGHGDSGSKHGG